MAFLAKKKITEQKRTFFELRKLDSLLIQNLKVIAVNKFSIYKGNKN
jgi:hypothetical protein